MTNMSTKTKHLGQAQPVHPKDPTGRAVAMHQVNTGASKRQRPRYRASRQLMRWDRILLMIGVVVVGLLLGGAIIGELTTPKGKLAAAQTSYNFGDVPIGGGDIITKFSLTVQGDARAIDITST